MPDLSGNKTALAASGHKLRGYFAVLTGAEVCVLTVDATPTAEKIKLLDCTVSSGDIADVYPQYRVVVETAGGSLKGELRVATTGTITANAFPVGEFANARVNVEATDVLRVYNIPVLDTKLPADNEGFDPDSVPYTTQNDDPDPLTNSGGLFVGFVDAGQTYATVTFTGSNSLALDPANTGGVTHAWTESLGATLTFTSGTNSASINPVIRLPVGYTLIFHTVYDADSSTWYRQYVPCYVYNSTTQPYDCLVESLDGDPLNSWSATVRLFANVGLSALPDGSLCAFFVKETINGTEQSFGSNTTNRSHIKMVGFITQETNTLSWAQNSITFSVLSPLARLGLIAGFSKVFISTNDPVNWTGIKSLTSIRALVQILRKYTTWTDMFDLVIPADARLYPALYIQKLTPLEQVRELADGLDCRFTCDRQGRGEIALHPAYIPLASRSGVTTTLTLDANDIIAASFTREHQRKIETMEVRGFTYGTSPQPIFCRWTGVPGEGTQSIIVERIIADSQDDLNERAGRRGALADGVFINADGVLRRAVTLRLTLYGSFDVFDFYKEWIAISLSGSTNLRGIALSDYRFWLNSVNVTYEGGTARVDLELMSETNALPGLTYVPPDEVDTDLPPIDVDPPITPDPGIGLGVATTLAVFQENGLLRKGSNRSETAGGFLTSTSTDLTAITNNPGSTVLQFVVDPFCPFIVGSGGTVNGYLLSTTHVSNISTVNGTPTFSNKTALSGTATAARMMDTSRSVNGWALAISYDTTNGMRCNYTTNGGAAWSSSTINAAVASGTNVWLGGLYMSMTVPGLAVATAFKAVNAFGGVNDTPSFGSWRRRFQINSTNGLMGWTLGDGTLSANGIEFALLGSPNAQAYIYASITLPVGTTVTRMYWKQCASPYRANSVGNAIYPSGNTSILQAAMGPNCTTTVTPAAFSETSSGTFQFYHYDQAPYISGGGAYITDFNMEGTGPNPFDAAGTGAAYVTQDYGATWTEVTDASVVAFIQPGSYPSNSIAAPLFDKPLTRAVYGGRVDGASLVIPKLYKSVGATDTDITPTVSSKGYGTYWQATANSGRQLMFADNDPNVLMMCGTYSDGSSASNDRHRVLRTDDAWASSPTWTALTAEASTKEWFGLYGVSRDVYYLIGEGTTLLGVWQRGTDSIDNRSGDISDTVVGITGIPSS